MKNDENHKKLRKDVEILANSMGNLRIRLNRLESYRDEEELVERLAGQSLRRINVLFLEAYHEILMLEQCFKD
ncbi:hypothetical protein C9426_23955 [Serratia sp. S1B]|nr:hypothetical protein C9426_23955 [Serratia sp. S1B]